MCYLLKKNKKSILLTMSNKIVSNSKIKVFLRVSSVSVSIKQMSGFVDLEPSTKLFTAIKP